MALVDQQLANVGAVVVEDRVLRRIIKRHRRLGVGLLVPHVAGYSLATKDLVAVVEPSELAIEVNVLPETVVAFTADRAALEAQDHAAWCHVWRTVFHARVHQVFDELLASNKLTNAAIRERVNRIGQIEFDEIRLVLRQENLLLPPISDASTYVEFVALFLELQLFDPAALAGTFPTIHEMAHVDATIALDIDAQALFAASRPPGAPDKPVIAVVEAPKAMKAREVVTVPSARRGAASARKRGNRARAAMLAIRSGDAGAARADLDELVARLSRALGCQPEVAWVDALYPIAEAAATRRVLRFTANARLLHDLQTACVVAEREVKVVDVMTWALSLGKRPVVRALPATREVRIAKHIRAAANKVANCEVSTPGALDRLATVLHDLGERADTNVRKSLRPKIEAALDSVDLRPHHLPERVGQNKLVNEMLDEAVAVGRFSLGHLRDAISHNDLKMTDLHASQLVRGDQLLRCDKQLSLSLDGVYRRGEGYLRFLQKLSSILFGTRVGRFLSKYVLGPAVGSYVSLEGLQHIVGPIVEHGFHRDEPHIAVPPAFAAVGVFLFLLLHVPPFRHGLVLAFKGLFHVLRIVLVDLPRAIFRTSLMRRFVAGPIWRWILKPAIPAAIAFVLLGDEVQWPIAAAIFVLVEIVGNSRYGRQLEEYAADWSVRSGRYFVRRLLPGLGKWLLDIFTELIELFDRALYRGDEWLRFRAGQSVVSLVIKGALGTVWFIITYFLRLYVNLFIEPVINPIKHFPTVTVAAKLTLPFSPQMISALREPLRGVVGRNLAGGFAAFTVFVIPGLAGFLVWELNANWKLYAATRPKNLGPISIGHHGETMGRFLRLGFHSGTIPKQFAKLRASVHKGDERLVARHKEALHHVGEAIEKFADRELVAMLDEATSFRANDVSVEHVEVGSNRVQIHIACPSVGDTHTVISFEQQSGWLIASVPTPGWIDRLDVGQRAIFELALAGFYKLAGVDLVREQLETALRGDGSRAAKYDISDEGLVVWPGAGYLTEIVYDLTARQPAPVVRGTAPDNAPAILVGQHALFAREPVAWGSFTTAWIDLANGVAPKRIIVGPSLLPAQQVATPAVAA
jgi:hypothetical protein